MSIARELKRLRTEDLDWSPEKLAEALHVKVAALRSRESGKTEPPFGAAMKTIRLGQGRSQTPMGDALGVGFVTVCRWETAGIIPRGAKAILLGALTLPAETDPRAGRSGPRPGRKAKK